MSNRTRLTDDQITAGLAALPDWTREGEAIVRTAETASFPTAIAVVGVVAEAAEELDHHPDIDIRWRTLRFVLSTHSAGGLTGLDLTMAARIDQALRTA
ncbi:MULTISPECIES: 4a-hydroxytetrahydrobiopterin dehydratase [unclassified Kitasatospora]|uniref:4a-hydroxytetrahydrobiopterin dehydratase n=1 Tax=unclassified Kitasatospora TaxID=2633591 RepID=UPI00070F370F|nr:MULTISPECIES: 4a-hydroxytetrahydrobiopterin dehydratase [unclassified Kitasatospora]KQV03228.1 pterin-4-alpha-carbinolamine dehydratase [Kitasatospora sp. Root107]KRB66189.1 pterin-4-alpha-carbinolamine dehydratase [Kitasatospora sp. Root187]